MKMAIKRGVVVGISLILQIMLSLTFLLFLGKYIAIIETFYLIFSILLVLAIIKESKNLSSDLPWIIIILLFPIAGALLYVVIGGNLHRSKILKNINKQIENSRKYLIQDEKIKLEMQENDFDKLKYISNYVGFPVTKNNDLKYYKFGELAYPTMLEELEKAEKFIFLEYFIINKGTMWNSILDVLVKKAKDGVDVRVIYDDMGCIAMLPSNYPKTLESIGIKCIAFNQVKPFLGVIMNNRDHRKMMIIDGRVVFTGGINLSDEYINKTRPHGVWKDNVLKIQGEAVWNFTVMFLSMWNSYRKDDRDYYKFKYNFLKQELVNGYIVPYGESPLDDEIVGENVYLNIINQAKKYLYIYTPYLIIDTDMLNALTLASKRGVEVCIIVPGIPDKKIVYDLTSSYFEQLIKYGVKIYKYKPGFVHSKVFLADDKIATVGTINMDYRSLYLHFECGVYMQDVNIIKDIKEDFEEAINLSHLVTKKEASPKLLKGLWQAILRLFAPLM